VLPQEGVPTMATTSVDATGTAATPSHGRGRRAPLIGLGVVGLGLVAVFGWSVISMTPTGAVQPQGVAVGIPGGEVIVQAVEHEFPDALGKPLPAGTHAVAVTLAVSADDAGPLDLLGADFVIEGTNIQGAVGPSRSTPALLSVPRGGTRNMTLVYALPDSSTNLALDLPGGARVSAEHADHPGDRATD